MTVEINGMTLPASLFMAYILFSTIVSVTVALYFTKNRPWQTRLACAFLAFMLSLTMFWNWVYLAALSIFTLRTDQFIKKGDLGS